MITTLEELKGRLYEIKEGESLRIRFTHRKQEQLRNENIIVKRYQGCLYRKKKITSRTLYQLYVNHYFDNDLVSVKIINPKEKIAKPTNYRREAAKVLNRLHPNIWEDMRNEYQAFIDGKTETIPSALRYNDKAKFRTITRIFPQYVIEEIAKAMENQTNYNYTIYGSKRDRSVSIQTKNGATLAWFSSEFSGCGNGDYYILINPTTALFIEHD